MFIVYIVQNGLLHDILSVFNALNEKRMTIEKEGEQK